LDSILNAVVPLFAVIFVGFLAGKGRVLSEDGVRGLNAFVFTFAMPPMLFVLMARTDVTAIGEWGFLAGYLYSEVLVFTGAAVLGGLLFRQRFAEMTMQGFGSCFSNGVLIALPLLIGLFGERGAAPAVLLFTLDVLMFSIVTMMLEIARGTDKPGGSRRGGGWRAVRTSLRSMMKNPILMSTLIGIVWGIFELPVPDLLGKTFSFIGQAGPPAALFALGATLAFRRVTGSIGAASAMVVFKLLLHPLAAFVILTWVVPVDPFWVQAAVIFAACPVGANVYVFAQHYGISVTAASASILVSTGLSLVTVTTLLLLFAPV
jgi:malonate transporter